MQVSAIITVQESALINGVMCGYKMSIIAEQCKVQMGSKCKHCIKGCSVQYVVCTLQGAVCKVLCSSGHKVPLCGMKPSDPCLALLPALIHNSLNDALHMQWITLHKIALHYTAHTAQLDC